MLTQTPNLSTQNPRNLQQPTGGTQKNLSQPLNSFIVNNNLNDSSGTRGVLNNLIMLLQQFIGSIDGQRPQSQQNTGGSASGNNLSGNNLSGNNLNGNPGAAQNNNGSAQPGTVNGSPNTGSAQSNAQSNNLTSMFSDRDKNLLLGALGIAPGSGTSISRIDDMNGSGTLNNGDNVVLQTPGGLRSRQVTNAQVKSFIEQRNPPDTPKLPLNSQQSGVLQNLHSINNAQVADINGDNRISEGDFVTGTAQQGSNTQQLDIPVNASLLQQLGVSGASGNTQSNPGVVQGGAPNNTGSTQPGSSSSSNTGSAQSNNLASMFNERDQNLLMGALGVAPGSGTSISRIDDANGSGTLNNGDNVVLQTPGGLQSRPITNAQVKSFIEQRNPPNTPKLPLNAQQSSVLQNLNGLNNAQVSDINGDNRISEGDFVTGTTRQGLNTQQLDIPISAELLQQLGAGGAQGNTQSSNNFGQGATPNNTGSAQPNTMTGSSNIGSTQPNTTTGSSNIGSTQPNTMTGSSNNTGSAQPNNLASMFSERDQNLLLSAIGVAPNSGTSISRIDDVNGTGTLNNGDNLVLQTSGGSQSKTITDAEVRKFIEQRNPTNTPKLQLNSQQSETLKNLHGFNNAQVADITGDQQLSVGDLITGTTSQGQRLDIPVTAELLSQLGGGQNSQSNFIGGVNSTSNNTGTNSTSSIRRGGGNGLLGS